MVSGKSALITGATGGIGFAISIKMTSLVETIVITGRNAQKLEEVKSRIQEMVSLKVLTFAVDLKNEKGIKELAEFIRENDLMLNYLVHCAGQIHTGSFQTSAPETFDSIYHINARAPFILTQELLPFIKKGNGHIIFINSSVVNGPYKDRGIYAFSKIALKGIADVLRQELNPEGIKVLSIFPGQTATQMQQKLHEDLNKTYSPELLIQPEDVADTVISTLTLASTIEVTDIYMRPMKNHLRSR